jgi:tRNA-2-methylthio-N6-dimethylallyladenosine synthase
MNVHESEKIAGILKKEGGELCPDIEKADLVVFNTCCIRDTAEKRALGNIGALKKRKRENKDFMIAVLGCMTQQEGFAEMMREKFPFVDIILGTNNLHLLPYYIKLKDKKNSVDIDRANGGTYDVNLTSDTFRTSFPNAWVNIMYGCDNFCSYCIVPYVRGREVSRPPKDVLNEIKFLLDEGYKEITLLGQNVNSYRYEDYDFKRLLAEAGNSGKKFRLRFMTSNPKDFDKDVIDVIKSSDNICKHIHLPAQSGSDGILRLMNRKYTAARYLDLVLAVRENIEDALISSDIMVGFPTETEEDFSQTLDLVKKSRFSQAFTFVYSPRSGTVSAKMEDVGAEVKKRRITELIRVQNKITKEISEGFKGLTREVLIESAEGDNFFGRTDNGRVVTFEKSNGFKIGDFVNVKITASKSSSLTGTPL